VSKTLDQTRRRIALGLVLPVAMIIAAVPPFWLFHERLPEPLASWWNLRGEPVDSMEHWGIALFIAVFCAFWAFAMFRVAFLPHAVRGEISAPIGVTVFASGGIVALSWLVVRSNLDVPAWEQAGFAGMHLILLAIVVVAGLGAAAGRFGRALETAPQPAAGNLPSAGLAPGARAVWVGTMHVKGVKSLAIIILAMALMSLSGGRGIGPLHVFVGVNFLLFSAIRVTVDRHGVRIVYGLLGWPVQRVRLAQIRHASMQQVKLLPWGGWTYQGSLRLLRRATIGSRDGQGIRLELEGERTLDIAIDDAEQAAGVINDLIAADREVVTQALTTTRSSAPGRRWRAR
jgi:hypothetical protein